MKVEFANNFFGPNHVLYRKDVVYDLPNEWKKLLPKTANIIEEPKKASVKQATVKKEASTPDENDPKEVAKKQAEEVENILNGKTK